MIEIPQPKRFILNYRAEDGRENCYEISNPFDETNNVIITYCFNRKGIRSFNKNKIVSIKEIKVLQD